MNIFCSGIGGIGLSAYASLQRVAGHTVSGSDRVHTPLLADLQEQGIVVSLQQDGSALPDNCDLFVYSEAIPKDSPERVQAIERGIQSLSYFQALGELSQEHRVIAVCGTHGKSSTTAMAATVLVAATLDPSVVVGTTLPDFNDRNWRKGDSNLFLLEACEYRRSFLALSPDIVLMTNVDGDHFDAFKDVEDYQRAFVEFLQKLPDGGTVITHMADPACAAVVAAVQKGRELTVLDADTLEAPSLSIPGAHMRENARLIAALGAVLDIDKSVVTAALKQFRGSWRRLEVKGEMQNPCVTVIDDYAHHPKEIAATIQAMKEAYPKRRLVCAYQPHMHDRTLKLYDDFLPSFSGADLVLFIDTYDARPDVEKDTVDMEKFAQDIKRESDVDCLYGGSLTDAERQLRTSILQEDDVLLVMGAGDVTELAERLVKN